MGVGKAHRRQAGWRASASSVALLAGAALICLQTASALNTTSAVNASCAGMESITKFTHSSGFGNQTFKMAVHIESPFVFYNLEATREEDLFSGLTIDIARLLEKELNCKFEFIVGNLLEPELPQGALAAIGQIVPCPPGATCPVARAQVAGGAIHISSAGGNEVHFSLPFYDTGYVLVVQTPVRAPNMWSFFLPFHFSLWVAVMIEVVIVATACWLMEAPVCSIFRDTDVVDGFFYGWWDSLYWSVTVLLQTAEKAPRTWGGKMVLVAHGWFMLILIASYTANLASFLTAAEAVPILSSWSDIVNSKGGFKLALPRGASHEDFIKVEQEHYPDANFKIEWTNTWEEAFEQVRNGTADVTFHDEPVAQEFILRSGWQCELIEVGKTFNSFGYGFAFNYDSTNFIAYSQAIVLLKETGLIDQLLSKYKIGPMDSGITDSCSIEGSDQDQMSWDEMQGLMIMVGGIILIGFAVNAIERLLHGKQVLMCCPAEEAEEGKEVALPNNSKFSRRSASELAEKVAENQRDEDKQALASALRAGVRAGVIEAIMKVAKDNENKVKMMEGNFNYKKQVEAMLLKGGDEQDRVARWKHQMENGANPGEKALLGKGGPLDLADEQLAEVHQVLAEWL